MRLHVPLIAAVGLGLGWLLATRVPVAVAPVAVAPVVVAPARPPVAPARTQPPAAASRLHVLVINGGGAAAKNYQSHLAHVRQLLAVLERTGHARTSVTVMSGDGADPAVRALQPFLDRLSDGRSHSRTTCS